MCLIRLPNSKIHLPVAAHRLIDYNHHMPGYDPFPDDPSIYELRTRAPGPTGALPLTEELLRTSPSGDIFGLTQNVGMGWEPERANDRQFLILSTAGGLRAPDGKQYGAQTTAAWPGSGVRLWHFTMPIAAGKLAPSQLVMLGYNTAGHVVWQKPLSGSE